MEPANIWSVSRNNLTMNIHEIHWCDNGSIYFCLHCFSADLIMMITKQCSILIHFADFLTLGFVAYFGNCGRHGIRYMGRKDTIMYFLSIWVLKTKFPKSKENNWNLSKANSGFKTGFICLIWLAEPGMHMY